MRVFEGKPVTDLPKTCLHPTSPAQKAELQGQTYRIPKAMLGDSGSKDSRAQIPLSLGLLGGVSPKGSLCLGAPKAAFLCRSEE